ncbi:MAG: hypothetical protein ACLU0O_11830 [Collinsella sp.]
MATKASRRSSDVSSAASTGSGSEHVGARSPPRSSVAGASSSRITASSARCPNCPSSVIAMPTNITSAAPTAVSTF